MAQPESPAPEPRGWLARKVNAYAERPLLFDRLMRYLRGRAPIRGFKPLGFAISSVCVTYLLAAWFSVGVHGLEGVDKLDRASNYPTANGLALIASGLYAVGGVITVLGIDPASDRTPRTAGAWLIAWFVGTGIVGGIGLAIVAIFVT